MVPLDANLLSLVLFVIRTLPLICSEKRGESGLVCSTGVAAAWFRERTVNRIYLISRCNLKRFAALKTVDGAEFVAGGSVFFLLGDGGHVGSVVGGGHGDQAGPEPGEGGVAVEVGVVFRVDVEEVEGPWIVRDGLFYVTEEAAQDGEFKGVEEEGEDGLGGQGMGGGVGVVEDKGGEGVGLQVVVPEGDIGVGDTCEVGVELDAFDAEEGELGAEQHGAAFAGADVEEDGAFDGLGVRALKPDV